MFGFKERPYFESDAGANKAPSVDFNAANSTKQEN